MEIKIFEERYRDDMIFMILEAKDALGRIPRLNEDLLDVFGNYILNGNMFWVVIDDNDRVIGSIGTKIISSNEMWLKRLYVKSTMKRKGIGTKLYKKAEEFAIQKGIDKIYVRFSRDYVEAHKFYPSIGFVETAPYEMVKFLK
ncbi:GNAT family N-acetyltransferase [Clostridium oryzae]|uniref:Putative acetyltransferase n=1 Tax=Clostridium oryzae TaxID=1450648 RepID=A0A1V4IKL8_9CLOT|nr:GNAT family N-acetyltransferase [Clostridium oryzae]OPJ60582.1 putative acetyltransferase [Clostridium oryzae]